MSRPFTEQDDKFITNNYLTMEYKELAEKIGRSRGSVSGRITTLVLPLKREVLTEKESRYIHEGNGHVAGHSVKTRYTDEYGYRKNKVFTYPTEYSIMSATERATENLIKSYHCKDYKIIEVTRL